MSNSINTNISAYFAQANIGTASNSSASSVSRLSSGNRIVKASDDVAALSTGTSLKTQVLALKTALTNASQGTSLLQVADGALSQVTEILQRQKAISLQAGSGSLTDVDRGYLDQEFQALSTEIDRLTGSTNFNGVKLLNGALSTSATLKNTSTNATAASASMNFIDNINLGENIYVNGVILTAASSSTGTATPASTSPLNFQVGNTLAETLDNLAKQLNDSASNANYSSALGAATYTSNGQTLTATAKSGGALSNAFTMGNAAPVVAGTNFITTASSSSVTITTAASTAAFKVGMSIIANPNTSAAVDGIAAKDLRGVITAVTATTVVFTAQSAASAGATTTAANSFQLDTVNGVGEASVSAGSVGSSFNLFTGATNFTTPTQAVAASTSTAAAPFQNGDSITAKVNGVTKTLYTVATNATITDLVNGINATSGDTGFRATLVYDQTNKYNIRLDYSGTAGNILLDVGANFHTSPTSTLTGDRFGTTANNITEAVGGHTTLISSGYLDLTGAQGSTGLAAATQGTAVVAANIAALTTTLAFVAGNSITSTLNGKTQVLHTFASGDTLNSIVNNINAHTADTGVYAGITGTGGAYNIRLFTTTATPATDQFYLGAGPNVQIATNTNNVLTTTNGGLSQTSIASLQGGLNNGLSQGSVSVSGTAGDSIITDLSQTKANVQLILTANAVAGTSTLTVGGKVFAFTSSTTGAAPDEILVGATIKDTINNAISTITNYAKNNALGAVAYELNQIDLSITNGNTLNFTGKALGNIETLASTAATAAYSTVSQSITGSSLTNSGALNNSSSTYGVDTTGITNPDFTGALQGFKATYKNSASTVDLSIKIGNNTYTALNAGVSVSSNTAIRLYSDTVDGVNGGYFDIQLKAGQVNAFSDQAGADAVAQRLNAAFSSLSFLQSRNMSSYTGSASITSDNVVIGSLFGSKVTAQLADFDGAKLSDVSVTAPSGSNTDTSISLTINGVKFSTASGIGSTLAANQTYRLTSANDPKQFVDFTTGNSTIVIDSAAKANAVADALKTAFGATAGSAALSFQIGSSSTDTLNVSIGSAQTSSLFGGLSLNVLSQANAVIAGDQLDKALATVTTLRASVGALQSRFNFASANIQIAVQNQDAARGELLDTDVATESTAFATSQVKLQAGISVLAQANQQLQNLLKLIQ